MLSKIKVGYASTALFGLYGLNHYYRKQLQLTPQCQADQLKFFFESGSTLNPKYDKRHKMGEDNLLVRPTFLCVLDGVGGWISVLVDSGTMTKEYITHLADIVDKNGMASDFQTSTTEMALKDILDEAMKKQKAKGSTTATMVFLKNRDKLELKTCNLGDSGYLLLRPESLSLQKVYRFESQQHYFNCPYQMGNHNIKPPSSEAFEISHDV
jgi:serine/threonine protein phosphatase PrpC